MLFGKRSVVADEEDRMSFQRPTLEMTYSGFCAFLSACGIPCDVTVKLAFSASFLSAASSPTSVLDFSGFLEAIVRVTDAQSRPPVIPSLSTPFVTKTEYGGLGV